MLTVGNHFVTTMKLSLVFPCTLETNHDSESTKPGTKPHGSRCTPAAAHLDVVDGLRGGDALDGGLAPQLLHLLAALRDDRRQLKRGTVFNIFVT